MRAFFSVQWYAVPRLDPKGCFMMRKRAFACAALSVAVACSLSVPSVAWATIEGDQTPATEEEIAAALADGTIKSEEQGASAASDVSQGEASLLAKKVSSSVASQYFSGATMFETAVAEAKAAFSQSDTVIIAGPGDAWVDALAAAGLAGALDCPILFTETDSLHPATKQALKDLGVKNAIVLGGTAAITDRVVSQLSAEGVALKTRLGGTDCYDTQMKIYEYGVSGNLWNNEMVIIATGGHYGDALSVSPVAYAKKAPIFLAHDKTKDLNDTQKSRLVENAKNGYGKLAVIAGGPAAVSDMTAGFADLVSSLAGGSATCTRLWGATQYETSAAIAKWAVSDLGFGWNNVAFATGDAPYDALSGSVLQGVSKSVLLLVSESNLSNAATASAGKASIQNVRFFGGEAAISMQVRMEVAKQLGFPYAALPGFKVYVDAGHGQNDTGNGAYASGAVSGGYVEAQLTKELAGMVSSILKSDYGVDVFLNDDGGPYKLRHAEAIAQGCDAIASIHFNAGGGTGSESLIHNYNAARLSSNWQKQLHPYLIKGVGLADRGMKTQEVAILGGTLPATLLEVCFIDNSNDMNQYQARKVEIAHKIAEGIVS